MAQSQLTVTPPNPTPPTNMSSVGATGPNPPNYTKATYADWLDNTKFDTAPPPYFDDGTAGPWGTFATNTAALASGTGATSGGTENTYPGGVAGAVPASTSAAHEAAGTETSVTNPGNISHTYVVGTMDTSKMYGVGPALTAASILAGPNASHASSENTAPTAAPTITGLLPVAPAATGGTTTLTVNGTNFRNGAVVLIGGIPYTTQYNSPTQLMVPNIAPKRTTAGNTAITVRVGATTTAATNWVFS